MTSQHAHTHAIAWHSNVEHERIQYVPDDGGNVKRGILIGLAISAVVWAEFGSGTWFALASVGVSS